VGGNLAPIPSRVWKQAVAFGVLDLSGPYRKTFDDTLPEATQVADPFHVTKLANQKLDECRRRELCRRTGNCIRRIVRSVSPRPRTSTDVL
jgi:transposase